MLETPHVVVGAAIATHIPNPIVSIPLAFLSHFALERIPHWNPHLNTEKREFGKITKKSTYIVIADSTLALASGFAIASLKAQNFSQFVVIILACFFSILPDLIEAPYFFLNLKSKFIEKWIKFQKSLQVDTTPLPGLLTQVITIIAAVWWIFK
jgi:hypothetical protein